MIIDTKKIIQDTKNLFEDFLLDEKIKDFVSETDYRELHTKPLLPTNIKIDADFFLNEIQEYEKYFVQWGKNYSHLPRYGVALVNQDGILDKKYDPINGSLYEYNSLNPNTPIIESDCNEPTRLMNISSLSPLNVFNRHWARSNVLKWGKNAEFVPHIDNIVPAPWLRLWGTMNQDVQVRFFDQETNQIIETDPIEVGRIYLIDTSIVHDAKYLGNDNAYQLFLCVLPSALNILKSLI